MPRIAGRATKFFRRASVTCAVAGLTIAAATGCDTVSPSASSATDRQVTVVGNGSVEGVPDTFTVQFGIEFTAPDLITATDLTNRRTADVVDTLVDAAVERSDITTTNVTAEPIMAPPTPTDTDTTSTQTTTPQTTDGTTDVPSVRPIAYRATNSLSVTVEEPADGPRVLAMIIDRGGDALRLYSVNYSIADDSIMVQDARANAFNDAKDRAEQFATLSNLQLGQVISISEVAGSGPVPAESRLTTEVPLEPGTQTVSFSVTVIWELV